MGSCDQGNELAISIKILGYSLVAYPLMLLKAFRLREDSFHSKPIFFGQNAEFLDVRDVTG